MASTINATTAGGGGVITTADSSGQLELQTGGTTAITVTSSQVASFANDFGTVAGYPAYQCRAWVNFNGTGTVAIRASGNVTSITDNGTGDYTVNFTTAMPDENYAVSGVGMRSDNLLGPASFCIRYGATTDYNNRKTTTSVRIGTYLTNNVAHDSLIMDVSVFR